MTDHPSLADLERAVEEAWSAFKPRSISDEVAGRRWITNAEAAVLLGAVQAWLAARRAARDAGMVSVLVSREAVEALRDTQASLHTIHGSAVDRLLMALARDLADVLKADGERDKPTTAT